MGKKVEEAAVIDSDVITSNAKSPSKGLATTKYPSWAKIGGVLGGVAAIIAILQFVGISRLSDFIPNIQSHKVRGSFISFRDTDFQINLSNDSDKKHFISTAQLLLKNSDGTRKIGLRTCCGVNSNVLSSERDSTLFLRSSAIKSNFGFYFDVLLPFDGQSISGSLSVSISKGQGEPYSLVMNIPTEQLTSWKNEKVIALKAMCLSWNGTKPRWCE